MNWINKEVLTWVLIAAGIGQLVLCLASPAIPVVLGWREQVRVLPKLLQQVFWTYACYVLGAHIVFGVLSAFCPGVLLGDGPLALWVCGFITVWWGARLALHLTTFDTSEVKETRWTKLAELGLGFLFVTLTLVYGLAVIYHIGGEK